MPWRVIDAYCARRPHASLTRLVRHGRGYVTVAADEGALSPWITWPTVHRGVPDRVHGLTDLGQSTTEVDGTHPPIWRLLLEGGVTTGVFGSLHTDPLPPDASRFAFYVPDTFAASPRTHPASVEVFQRFNLAMVDRNGSNVSRGLPLADAARLALRFPFLGGRARTMTSLISQLASERVAPWRVVRRRTAQSQIGFDLYARLLNHRAPRYSAFFTNHVASAMHRYWPAAFPEDYRTPIHDSAWSETYSGEIDYAMDEADHQLGRLMQWVDAQRDAALWVVSSMGQAAVDDGHPPLRTQVLLAMPERLMAALGIPAGTWTRMRTMEPDYTFRFVDGHDIRALAGLQSIRVDGRPIRVVALPEATVAFSFGQRNLDDKTLRVELSGQPCPLEHLGLRNTMKQDEADVDAYHVPEGVAMIYDDRGPRADKTRPRISTLDLAPSMLASLGVTPPSYMRPSAAL